MRHRVKGRKLGRTTPHRKATLRALSSALIREHRIKTTLPKAKELRTFVEPLITRAKVDSTHNRRIVYSYLQDKHAVTELFETVGPAAADRPGGYTRVLKLGFRVGDAAEMAVIELVDFNDVQPEGKEAKKKKTRRAGKSVKSDPVSDKKDVKKSEEKAEEKSEAKGEEASKAKAEVVVEEENAEATVESSEDQTVDSQEVKETKAKAKKEEKNDDVAEANKETKSKKESDDVAAQQEEADSEDETEEKK